MADRERPESESSGDRAAGDPAAAFDALRAEVASLREDIEALQTELAESRGPDLTPTLAQIAKAQAITAQHLGVIQQHPALKMTPAEHGEAIRRAGGAALGEAAHSLHSAASSVRDYAQQLAIVTGTSRTKRRQLEVLAWSTATALLAGLLLAPFAARLLPFGLDTHGAASVLATDRWNAGAVMMQAEDADAWRGLMENQKLAKTNQAMLATCREAAVKAKKEQRCTIVVPAPE